MHMACTTCQSLCYLPLPAVLYTLLLQPYGTHVTVVPVMLQYTSSRRSVYALSLCITGVIEVSRCFSVASMLLECTLTKRINAVDNLVLRLCRPLSRDGDVKAAFVHWKPAACNIIAHYGLFTLGRAGGGGLTARRTSTTVVQRA